jgi:hypothetical protein
MIQANGSQEGVQQTEVGGVDEFPQNSDNNCGNDVGHVKNNAVVLGFLQLALGNHSSAGQSQTEKEDTAEDEETDIIQQSAPEIIILEDTLKVLEADEIVVTVAGPVCHRIEERLDQRGEVKSKIHCQQGQAEQAENANSVTITSFQW